MAHITAKPNIIFTSVAMNTATTSSKAINVMSAEGFSVQALFGTIGAAGVTGSFKLQASCDFAQDLGNPDNTVTHWTDVSGSSQAVLVSGSGNSVLYNVSAVYYPWLRLTYVGTAGSGSMDARILVKNR